MLPCPEQYIQQQERMGNLLIGVTNLPRHFAMGQSYVLNCKHVRMALGFHPLLAAKFRQELSLFDTLISQTSYVGEIGLDFSREGIVTKCEQVSCLRYILERLQGKKKIISVHSRCSEKELLELLTEYNIENVIFHWYSGDIRLIPRICDKGYYFSINQAMTMSNNGREILKRIPIGALLTESDAPYNKCCDIARTRDFIGVTEEQIKSNFLELLHRIY